MSRILDVKYIAFRVEIIYHVVKSLLKHNLSMYSCITLVSFRKQIEASTFTTKDFSICIKALIKLWNLHYLLTVNLYM